MNILITGIHCFVGSNVVASLNSQHIIFGVDIVSPQTPAGQVVAALGINYSTFLRPVSRMRGQQ